MYRKKAERVPPYIDGFTPDLKAQNILKYLRHQNPGKTWHGPGSGRHLRLRNPDRGVSNPRYQAPTEYELEVLGPIQGDAVTQVPIYEIVKLESGKRLAVHAADSTGHLTSAHMW